MSIDLFKTKTNGHNFATSVQSFCVIHKSSSSIIYSRIGGDVIDWPWVITQIDHLHHQQSKIDAFDASILFNSHRCTKKLPNPISSTHIESTSSSFLDRGITPIRSKVKRGALDLNEGCESMQLKSCQQWKNFPTDDASKPASEQAFTGIEVRVLSACLIGISFANQACPVFSKNHNYVHHSVIHHAAAK